MAWCVVNIIIIIIIIHHILQIWLVEGCILMSEEYIETNLNAQTGWELTEDVEWGT